MAAPVPNQGLARDVRFERLVLWREAESDLRVLWREWKDGRDPGAGLAYGAALDREEAAARNLAECVESSRSPSSSSP